MIAHTISASCLFSLVFALFASSVTAIPSNRISSSTNEYELVTKHLEICGHENVVVLVDKHRVQNRGFIQYVLNVYMSHSIPFTYVEYLGNENVTSPQSIRYFLNHIFGSNVHQPTLFTLMTSRSVEILNLIDKYLSTDRRARGEIFQHISRWLVVVTSLSDKRDVIRQQRNSVLDHVTLLYEKRSKPVRGQSPHFDISIFRWRANRTRTPDEVEFLPNPSIFRKCVLYPNIDNAMNGRRLVVVAKEYEDVMVKVAENNKTGRLEYQGFVIDFLNLLARVMNFTYVLTPPANETPIDSWTDVIKSVESGEVDFGASFWSYDWSTVYKIKLSIPVIYDQYTGLYRRQVRKKSRAVLLIKPFSKAKTAIVLGTFLYCIAAYMFLDLLKGFVLQNKEQDQEDKDHLSKEDDKMSDIDSVKSISTTPLLLFDRIQRTVYNLVMTLLNQSSFPNTKYTSARIILFLFSFSTVIYYALYTGLLTANIATPQKEHVIGSFEELLDTESFHCRVMISRTQSNNLKNSPNEVLGRLYRLCQEDYSPTETVLTHLKRHINKMNTSTVFMAPRNPLKRSIRYAEKPEEYTIIGESLLNGDKAFSFPGQSKLPHMFTEAIQVLRHSGMTDQLHARYFEFMDDHTKEREINNSNTANDLSKKIKLEDLIYVFMLTTALTMLAFILLLSEWIVVWRRGALAALRTYRG